MVRDDNASTAKRAHPEGIICNATLPPPLTRLHCSALPVRLLAVSVLHSMSQLLQTGLTRDQLSLCITLCESGVNPEALAAIVKELKREAQAMQQQ